MNEYVMQIILAVIGLVISIGGGYLVKYLSAKTGNENLARYYEWAKIAVNAAEQMLGAGAGINKKEEVIAYLIQKFGNKITSEDINKLIEAAVYQMNLVLKDKGLENKPSLPRDNIEPVV